MADASSASASSPTSAPTAVDEAARVPSSTPPASAASTTEEATQKPAAAPARDGATGAHDEPTGARHHEPPGAPDPLVIAGREFRSRLLVGTGKFSSPQALADAIKESGTQIVTVALRRVDLTAPDDPQLSVIDPAKVLLLPNTSGARDADEAIRLAHLARELAGHSWLKLEVTPDPATLLPDAVETLKAAERLVADGFTVLPYINADPILALRLQDVGCATVMPLGSPIGTNRGINTRDQIRIIIEQARVPVVVDAGLGVPSHAAEAMEMGADAVLVNTALAVARDAKAMARAFALGVEAGRMAFLAGPGEVRAAGQADASSPLTGFLDQR